MSQRETVLQALRDAGDRGVTNGELNRLGIFRYSARIHELRQAGHTIRTENGEGGLATFFLEHDVEAQAAAPPAPVSPGVGASSGSAGGEQAGLFDAPPVATSAVTGKPVAA